jgi:hypothetical protein
MNRHMQVALGNVTCLGLGIFYHENPWARYDMCMDGNQHNGWYITEHDKIGNRVSYRIEDIPDNVL